MLLGECVEPKDGLSLINTGSAVQSGKSDGIRCDENIELHLPIVSDITPVLFLLYFYLVFFISDTMPPHPMSTPPVYSVSPLSLKAAVVAF